MLIVLLSAYDYLHVRDVPQTFKLNPIGFIKDEKIKYSIEGIDLDQVNANESIKIKLKITNTDRLIMSKPFIAVQTIKEDGTKSWFYGEKYKKNNLKNLVFMNYLEDEILLNFNNEPGNYEIKFIVFFDYLHRNVPYNTKTISIIAS
ncbi:hypothetical protein J4216_04375 [Candidatus Woesearchaeota archaeon]|nr:hypothetical protein [Candidatus Woesearchaeota archaeon]